MTALLKSLISAHHGVGGDKFDVKAKRVGKGFTAAVVVGKVEDMGDGVYRGLYIPNFAGSYEKHVTSKSAHIRVGY